jgi:hypothetical protein
MEREEATGIGMGPCLPGFVWERTRCQDQAKTRNKDKDGVARMAFQQMSMEMAPIPGMHVSQKSASCAAINMKIISRLDPGHEPQAPKHIRKNESHSNMPNNIILNISFTVSGQVPRTRQKSSAPQIPDSLK